MRLSSKPRIATHTSIVTRLSAGIMMSALAASADPVVAQQYSRTNAARTELKPLGAPSAVDQFRRTKRTNAVTETSWQAAPPSIRHSVGMQPDVSPIGINRYGGNIRQVAAMQSQDGFALPDNAAMQPPTLPNPQTAPGPTTGPSANTAPPPMASPPGSIPDTAPYSNAGPTLPSPSINGGGAAVSPNAFQSSPSDLQPMAVPALGDGLARVENCNQVTAPSSYYLTSSRYGGGCGPVYPTTYTTPIAGPVTTTVAPGTLPPEIPAVGAVLPPATPPVFSAAPAAAPARALISFGQENYPVQVGQGLWGQPVAYVPGQGLRNWLRYMSF